MGIGTLFRGQRSGTPVPQCAYAHESVCLVGHSLGTLFVGKGTLFGYWYIFRGARRRSTEAVLGL